MATAPELAIIIKNELKELANKEKAIFLQRFFKTGKGEYAEGDQFLGITVPYQRNIAKAYFKDVDLTALGNLLQSVWHECRLTALIMLTMKMKKEKSKAIRQTYVDLYLSHIEYVNNWDLVDLSAPYILGIHLIDESDKSLLYSLAISGELWKQRIAIITTLYFIRKHKFDDALALAKTLLHHPHDLIHKAVGWVLREIGKRDKDIELSFLNLHYHAMPRTTLRYAIERFSQKEREYYLHKAK